MSEYKTVLQLNSKMWYRALKVLFLSVFFVVLLALVIDVLSGDIGDFLIGLVMLIGISFVLRGSFYYIVLGKFTPDDRKLSAKRMRYLIDFFKLTSILCVLGLSIWIWYIVSPKTVNYSFIVLSIVMIFFLGPSFGLFKATDSQSDGNSDIVGNTHISPGDAVFGAFSKIGSQKKMRLFDKFVICAVILLGITFVSVFVLSLL